MDTSNQNQPQYGQPQIQQTVVVVGKQKSVGVAFLLAFLFGPLGLLYASVTGGIVMFILGILISIVTFGIGLIFVWIGCIIWAVVAAGNANKKMTSAAGLHINTNFGGQPQQVKQQVQPLQQVEPVYKQTPLPIQEVKPEPFITETPKENISEPKPFYQETNIPNPVTKPSFDLSQWFDKNKKSVIIAGGGIVVLLILFIAIKFVFSIDFKKSNTSSIETSTSTNAQENIPTNQNNENASLSVSGASIANLKVGENFSFPIITLPDQSKSDRINAFIINAVLGEEFNSNNLKSKLEERKKEVEKSYQGLTSLSYNIVFNNPSILSLGISRCDVGNRENCEEVQYNFDLNTGYIITLDQIIKPSRKYDIKQLIVPELIKRLNKSKADMIKNGDWLSEYESSIQEEINQAQLQFEPSSFKLSDKGISFVYFCMPFALVYRNYFPSQDYFYSWSSIKDYLNPSSPISNIIFSGQQAPTVTVSSNEQYQSGNYIVNGNVSDKAYFYNTADYSTKRKGYFSTQENVYVQKFENGFGYVQFTNTNGQTSYGWIETKYLISKPN